VETISQIFGASAGVDIRIPEQAIPGSLQGTLKIYPNLNAHVLESIEGILGRPYGCAEQTVSSAYPGLLLLRYAKDTPGAPAAELERAKRYLRLGRDRLTAYQASRGGITYWGRGEPDIALTVYGLKFLSDAREFLGTDDYMGQENLSWLLQQAQPDGRWVASSWDGKEDLRRTAILTAYIARVLATAKIAISGPAENERVSKEISAAVTRALDYLEPQVAAFDEPYLIASYALTSFAAGQKSRAEQSVERLRKLERREGDSSYWSLETNTPFYGWGLAGRIETTALVLQALHEGSENAAATDPLLSRGLLFLLRNQDRLGVWYSTQATVNVLDTLRALTSPANSSLAGGSTKSTHKA
jgi:uncharacterized protein YfaS (alpha-2-macroglobulin family)